MRLLQMTACLQACRSSSLHLSGRRTLLTQAFYCKNEWNARFSNPKLQSLNPDDFSRKVYKKLENDGAVAAIDMDVIANTLSKVSPEMHNFILNMFAQHRRTKEALDATESLSYGLLRCLMEQQEYDGLITVLQDKVKYGIFLDDYTASMIMDHFIKQEDWKRAAAIAYDLMLQETVDTEPTLVNALVWHSCHNHRKNNTFSPVDWTQEEDEEVRYIRVEFLATPYYDDHFDIPHEAWKLGKTFQLLTRGKTDVFNLSYNLIGLALHDKYEKAIDLLNTCLKTEDQSVANEAMQCLQQRLEAVETEEPPEEPKDLGLRTVRDYVPRVTQAQKEKLTKQIQELSEKLKAAKKITEYDLDADVKKFVPEWIENQQKSMEEEHKKQLKEWADSRLVKIDEEIVLVQKKQQIRSLGEQLRELQLKEEKLRFFEDYDKIVKFGANTRKFTKIKVEKQYRQALEKKDSA